MQNTKILFISSYPPRQCGIATFTRDLADAIRKKYVGVQPRVIAINEEEASLHKYGNKVMFTITEAERSSYENALRRINSMKGIGMLNIQHEFGLFGGEYGEYLLDFMRCTNKKIVTTLHTVLENPPEKMRTVLQEIFEHSEKVIVMTRTAKNILASQYKAAEEKIVVIPHGVPLVKFGGSTAPKKKYGVAGKKVLLTFGLLNRGKGVENVIEALPTVLAKHPDITYLVVGETHPKVRMREGESYRKELLRLVAKKKLHGHVKFLDKFVSLKEIIECLEMANIYVAPSLDPNQISSGTVSYAVSAGKAIIASKNKYNSELLSEGRGILVENNSPKEFAEAIIKALGNHELRATIEKNAFEYSRKMTWPNVATAYCNIFSKICGTEIGRNIRLPSLSFRHLYRMTDEFGVIQFAKYSEPDIESGYTLDDNARALVATTMAYEKRPTNKLSRYANTYLKFIENAQMRDGNFNNIFSPNREPAHDSVSEDSFGRAVWALGETVKSKLPEEMRLRSKRALEKAIEPEPELNSPRAQASTLIGLVSSLDYTNQNGMKDHILESLLASYDATADSDWKWFETYLTYANSLIPQALFEAHSLDSTGKAMRIAQESMGFLTKKLFIDGTLVPIGQENWYSKNGKRSMYDQQPIEAACMTTAYLKAHEKTGETTYLDRARASFEWFLGRNSQNIIVYDEATSGCYDGITRSGVNANQGAESTISYLIARLSLG